MAMDHRFRHALIAAALGHGGVLIWIGWSERAHVAGGHFERTRTPMPLEVSLVEREDPLVPLRPSVSASPSPVANPARQQQRAAAAVTSTTTTGLLLARDAPESDVAVDSVDVPADAPGTAAPLISPPLTRDQLGLSVGDYSSVLPKPSPEQADQQERLALNQKLEQSLRQDAEERAGDLGLGKEGPILARLTQLAQQSPVDLSGFATIHVRLLKGGAIELDLLGTSSDRSAWTRLLEQAKVEMLALKLTPPQGSRGVDWMIRVDSRVQLPSGADPGFNVKAFGVPLRKGRGKRSSGIEILSSLPKIELDESITAEGERRQSARLKLDILKMPLDPVDLSGKQSRIVSARVLKRTVL